MRENPDKRFNQAAVRANDARIGRGFRWSVLVFVTLVIMVAGGRYVWQRLLAPSSTVTEQHIEGPVKVETSRTAEIPAVRFSDITKQAGISFVHSNGADGEKLLPETMGGGVAFLDYDNDNDPDLLFINSSDWPDSKTASSPAATMSFYRNDGNGRFTDVTVAAGLDVSFYGMGVATGDYDGDGFTDLFITAVGTNRLYRNNNGTFHDTTGIAGVAGSDSAWSTSAAFFDYDNDGDLDLFVANYVQWSREIDFELDFRLTGIGRAYGPPTTFSGTYPYLYRNDGDGSFTDISAVSGIQVNNPATGQPVAKALAVAVVDIDLDGWQDLFVANDTVQNFLYHNRGDGTFSEEAVELGVAFDRNGNATGAMGVDAAWYRNTDELGLAIGNFANEMTSLYVSQGEAMQFADEAISDGLAAATRRVLSFGLFFFDYDLDGRLDLLQANGHLEDQINQVQPSQHYRQPAQLFWNCGDKCKNTFIEVATEDTGDLAKPIVGRGAAYADIDADGDLDVVITQIGGSPSLLRNDQQLNHHWLKVRLVGNHPNHEAIGAVVRLSASGVVQQRQVLPARSYLSQVELPLTFGLGDTAAVDWLEIRWPDGSTHRTHDIHVDSLNIIEQTDTTIHASEE